MVPIVTDENISGGTIRALKQFEPSLDLVRVQDVGLQTTPDPEILEWAAENERIVVTHDRNTFTSTRMPASKKEKRCRGF